MHLGCLQGIGYGLASALTEYLFLNTVMKSLARRKTKNANAALQGQGHVGEVLRFHPQVRESKLYGRTSHYDVCPNEHQATAAAAFFTVRLARCSTLDARFMLPIRFYHDIHQRLLGINVALHAFSRQFRQR